jgi:hypothetical protein
VLRLRGGGNLFPFKVTNILNGQKVEFITSHEDPLFSDLVMIVKSANQDGKTIILQKNLIKEIEKDFL